MMSKVEGQGMLVLNQDELDHQLGAMEALLFAVGDDGVSLEQMEYALDVDEETALSLLEELKRSYEKKHSG